MSTRRELLRLGLGSGAWAVVSCKGGAVAVDTGPVGGVEPSDSSTPLDTQPFDSGRPSDSADTGTPCEDLWKRGTFEAVVPFSDQSGVVFHEKLESGLDARIVTDLAELDADHLEIDNDRFMLRSETPHLLSADASWTVRVQGLVDTPYDLEVGALVPSDQGAVLIECSGNSASRAYGLMAACRWGGVSLADVLDAAAVQSGATMVKVSGADDYLNDGSGHSTVGAAWVFPLDQLEGAFLATTMNGEALPSDHGWPVRLMVPGWYGCCLIKWVSSIELVDDSEPATSQMQEFASRIQQSSHSLAKDYEPATMTPCAMPVRVERWSLDGGTVYRVVGILWGDGAPAKGLQVRFGSGGPWEDVAVCPAVTSNATWTLWEHLWRPVASGSVTLRCRIDAPALDTPRLDDGYYDRSVTV